MTVDLLWKIADKKKGKHDGNGGHRAGENWSYHLLGTLNDSHFQILLHLLEVALDIFQYHHRVVHQHAQGQNDGGINDDIEITAHEPANGEGAEKDHGDGEERCDYGSEIAQEKQNYQQGKDDGVAQGVQHVGVGGFNQYSLSICKLKVDVPVTAFEFFDLGPACFGGIQHRATRGSLNGKGDGWFAVSEIAGEASLVLPGDGGDIA